MPQAIKSSGLVDLFRLRDKIEPPPPEPVDPEPEEEIELFQGSYASEGLDGWKEPLMIVPGFEFRVGFKTFTGLFGAIRTLENQLELGDFDPTYDADDHPMDQVIRMVNRKYGDTVLEARLEYVYDYVRYTVKKLGLKVDGL